METDDDIEEAEYVADLPADEARYYIDMARRERRTNALRGGHMDKILFAMVGASDLEGKPSGFMTQGMCIPLAATGWAREAIEAVGEDAVADWFEASAIEAPKAGGLWVAEIEMRESADGPQGYSIDSCGWRPPTPEELDGLLGRQMARARQDKTAPKPPGAAAWTFIGALA
jgi:hypothetical protein